MWATLPLTELPTVGTHTFVQIFKMPECRTVQYWNKGTPVPYRNATVPDLDAGCQNTDARSIGLNANAQLWYRYSGILKNMNKGS